MCHAFILNVISQNAISEVYTLDNSIKRGFNLMCEGFKHHVSKLSKDPLIHVLLVLSYVFHLKLDLLVSIPQDELV